MRQFTADNKRLITALLVFILIGSSCSEEKKTPTPMSALETAQAFIRMEMTGNFEEAETFLIQEAPNLLRYDSLRTEFSLLSKEKKKLLRKQPAVTINTYEELTDSTALLRHTDPILKKEVTLQLIRKAGKWQIRL